MHMRRPTRQNAPSLPLVLLFIFLVVLWLAGGASRADVPGQVVVRGAAWAILLGWMLVGNRPAISDARPLWLLAGVIVAISLVQLVPLPPAVWQGLPGRGMFTEAAMLSGQLQPWRPWAIVPGAARNAASSLVVPVAALLLVTGLKDRDRAWLPGLILGLISASTIVGLLEFSGVGFNNPLVNDTPGQVSGTFANRNHFALFLAMGCLVAPVWAFLDGRRPRWRAPMAMGLVLLFTLTILASGSRAGLLLGLLAIVLGLAMSWQGMRNALKPYPKWVFPAFLGGLVSMIGIAVLIAVAADRAVSISRVFSLDEGQDMRSRGLPTVLTMIRTYFPMGSGLGGFDPLFRIHEPFTLLKLTYFNHAHNDFLEVVLDAGLAGLLLIVSATAWWGWASIRAWRAGASIRYAVPKLGSAMLLLVLIASGFDYPARTPLIMAMIVVAAVWTNGAGETGRSSTLRGATLHL